MPSITPIPRGWEFVSTQQYDSARLHVGRTSVHFPPNAQRPTKRALPELLRGGVP